MKFYKLIYQQMHGNVDHVIDKKSITSGAITKIEPKLLLEECLYGVTVNAQNLVAQ